MKKLLLLALLMGLNLHAQTLEIVTDESGGVNGPDGVEQTGQKIDPSPQIKSRRLTLSEMNSIVGKCIFQEKLKPIMKKVFGNQEAEKMHCKVSNQPSHHSYAIEDFWNFYNQLDNYNDLYLAPSIFCIPKDSDPTNPNSELYPRLYLSSNLSIMLSKGEVINFLSSLQGVNSNIGFVSHHQDLSSIRVGVKIDTSKFDVFGRYQSELIIDSKNIKYLNVDSNKINLINSETLVSSDIYAHEKEVEQCILNQVSQF